MFRSFLVFLLFSCSQAGAKDLVENQTNAALQTFYGLCYNDRFNAEQLTELATRLGWRELSKSETDVMFSRAASRDFDYYSSFIIETPPPTRIPALVFGGSRKETNHTVQVCTLYFTKVLWTEIKDALDEESSLIYLYEEPYEDHTMHFYKSTEWETGGVGLETTKWEPRGVRINFIKNVPD